MTEQGAGAGGQEGGSTPPAGGTGATGQEGSDDKTLESLEPAKLAKMLRETRQEAKSHRERAEAAEGKIEAVTKRVQELEDSSKTEEQKTKDRQKALEELAAKVPGLQRFESYVKNMLDGDMKAIEALKAAEKKPYTDLLATIPENDPIARIQAISVLRSALARGQVVREGDESNPAETGGGLNDKTFSQKLAWSSAGTREAHLAGMIPASK